MFCNFYLSFFLIPVYSVVSTLKTLLDFRGLNCVHFGKLYIVLFHHARVYTYACTFFNFPLLLPVLLNKMLSCHSRILHWLPVMHKRKEE